MESKYSIILTTCPNSTEAKALASSLIESRLAACVQANPVLSTYRWEGKVEQDEEIRLMIKTVTGNYKKIERLIKENHSYDNPQIISIPVENGSQEYLDWIGTEVV